MNARGKVGTQLFRGGVQQIDPTFRDAHLRILQVAQAPETVARGRVPWAASPPTPAWTVCPIESEFVRHFGFECSRKVRESESNAPPVSPVARRRLLALAGVGRGGTFNSLVGRLASELGQGHDQGAL